MLKEKPKFVPKNLEAHPDELTLNEFIFILSYWGHTQQDFLRFIHKEKNRTYISRTLWSRNPPNLPLKHNKDLERLLGPEDYQIALVMVKNRRKEKTASEDINKPEVKGIEKNGIHV